MQTQMRVAISLTCLGLLLGGRAVAQEKGAADFDAEAVIQEGCSILLQMQENMEGDPDAAPREWPYEGVYRTSEPDREGRVIPIGYRVGGTAISSLALIQAPGYSEHEDRQAAVDRAVEFLLEALDADLMSASFADTYDVRGWGHVYALALFLRMADLDVVPERHAEGVAAKTRWLVDALLETAIPDTGGWNYARRHGFGHSENSPSPFMTAPAILALLHAKERGYDVDPEVLGAALDSLERGRTGAGGMTYSIPSESRFDVDEAELSMMDKMQGSIARLPAVETTLLIAGRGDPQRLQDAVERFFEHWNALEVRRQQDGTHVRPYGVAPYYFIYGHYYVAQAIELLEDRALRERQRTRFHDILASVREPHGGWNDRVFPRSRNFGTAMGMMALQMRALPRPSGR